MQCTHSFNEGASKTVVSWNPVSMPTTVYELLFCKPSMKTYYCMRASRGYTSTGCTVGQDRSLQCDVTALVRKEFADLYDPHSAIVPGGHVLCFVVMATNKAGQSYSRKKCCDDWLEVSFAKVCIVPHSTKGSRAPVLLVITFMRKPSTITNNLIPHKSMATPKNAHYKPRTMYQFKA